MPQTLHRFKAEFFKALGHPTRLRILERLRSGEQTVSELQAALDQSKQAEEQAKDQRRIAEENARQAEKAQGEAEAAKDEILIQKGTVEALLKQEQERVRRMQQQIGSPIVDDLK